MISGIVGTWLFSSLGKTNLEFQFSNNFYVKVYDGSDIIVEDNENLMLRMVKFGFRAYSIETYKVINENPFTSEMEFLTWIVNHPEYNDIYKTEDSYLYISDAGFYSSISDKDNVTWLEGTNWHWYWSDNRVVMPLSIEIYLWNTTNVHEIDYTTYGSCEVFDTLDDIVIMKERNNLLLFPKLGMNVIRLIGCSYNMAGNNIINVTISINGNVLTLETT